MVSGSFIRTNPAMKFTTSTCGFIQLVVANAVIFALAGVTGVLVGIVGEEFATSGSVNAYAGLVCLLFVAKSLDYFAKSK